MIVAFFQLKSLKFIGYSLDLIDGISKLLGFKYVFELTPDNAYGSYDKEKKSWNGLVKQLLDRVSNLTFAEFQCEDHILSFLITSRKQTWQFVI